MKNKLIFALIILAFFSCEKTIKIDIPDEGRKLTVNSFFTKDSLMQIQLTKSRYILDEKQTFEPVNNAKITVFENDKLIDEISNGNSGYYSGNYPLKTGKTYKIQVSTDNFPVLNAQSIIPEKTKIISLDAEKSFDAEGWLQIIFNLKFKDDILNENSYLIEVTERIYATYTNYETGLDTTVINDYNMYLSSDDPNTYSDSYYAMDGLLLSDDLFNGKEYTLQFKGQKNWYSDSGSSDKSEYIVKFSTISKDYYLYYKSYSLHMEAQDEFFMEPVQVYTNIENGFGIFAGYSVYLDSVQIQ